MKEEKAFLVIMSIAIGAVVCSVALVGKHLSLDKSLLMGLAIALLYPSFIIAMVRFSVALKSWAHRERYDDWIASDRETLRAYLFVIFPVVLPVLVVFYVSFGIKNRLFNYKAV